MDMNRYEPKSVHVGFSHKSACFSARFTKDLYGIVKVLFHDQTKRLSIEHNACILEIALYSTQNSSNEHNNINNVIRELSAWRMSIAAQGLGKDLGSVIICEGMQGIFFWTAPVVGMALPERPTTQLLLP
jgi:hypothetical protein